MERLSTQLAVSFVRAVTNPALAAALGRDTELLALRALTTPDADRWLRQILVRYRQKPETWAPVLLKALAPILFARLARLTDVLPVIDFDDIAQQLVVEILERALSMPINDDTRFVAQRLLLDAGKEVTRWLRREQRQQAWHNEVAAILTRLLPGELQQGVD